MQNLEWKDKIDNESDIEAKDVNSLANAIITIIDWINNNGNNGDIDLTDYVKKEEGKGLSQILNVRIENGADVTSANSDYFKEIYVDNQYGETIGFLQVYDVDQIKSKLSEKPSMSDVEAYIEETLLGGAW